MNQFAVMISNPKTYFIQRLIEEVGHRTILFNPWEDSKLGNLDSILVRTSGINRDDRDLEFLRGLSPNVRLINSLESIEIFRGKDTQYPFFQKHHFPHLPWGRVTDSDLENKCSELLSFSGDLIVKPRRGLGGWGVKKLSLKEFTSWLSHQRSDGDLDYLIQPFIPAQKELRLFFCGEYRLCLERSHSSGGPANFRAGGEAKIVKVPEEFKSMLESLILHSKASYGAIDFLVHKNHPFILELNVIPGIEQAEGLSGDNIMVRILNQISL